MLTPVPLPKPDFNLNYTTVMVPPGVSICGYMLAKPYGVWTHYNGQVTKPCRRLMSGEQLPCLICAKKKARWYAYQPLLVGGEVGRVCVILSKRTASEVDRCKVWSPIKLSRPLGDGKRLLLEDSSAKEIGFSLVNTEATHKPEDIGKYLLNLWQDEVLATHHGYLLPKPVPVGEPAAKKGKADRAPPGAKPARGVTTPKDLLAYVAEGMNPDAEPQAARAG